jgi:hypothetical protein
MYTYSFLNEELMEKCSPSYQGEAIEGLMENLVPMKNALSEELTHLR